MQGFPSRAFGGLRQRNTPCSTFSCGECTNPPAAAFTVSSSPVGQSYGKTLPCHRSQVNSYMVWSHAVSWTVAETRHSVLLPSSPHRCSRRSNSAPRPLMGPFAGNLCQGSGTRTRCSPTLRMHSFDERHTTDVQDGVSWHFSAHCEEVGVVVLSRVSVSGHVRTEQYWWPRTHGQKIAVAPLTARRSRRAERIAPCSAFGALVPYPYPTLENRRVLTTTHSTYCNELTTGEVGWGCPPAGCSLPPLPSVPATPCFAHQGMGQCPRASPGGAGTPSPLPPSAASPLREPAHRLCPHDATCPMQLPRSPHQGPLAP
eukprot:Sspe_Gene.105510::Locus_82544_Transcript_1_1_Confidence_1.000_Length_1161::g.105510::m.105510